MKQKLNPFTNIVCNNINKSHDKLHIYYIAVWHSRKKKFTIISAAVFRSNQWNLYAIGSSVQFLLFLLLFLFANGVYLMSYDVKKKKKVHVYRTCCTDCMNL